MSATLNYGSTDFRTSTLLRASSEKHVQRRPSSRKDVLKRARTEGLVGSYSAEVPVAVILGRALSNVFTQVDDSDDEFYSVADEAGVQKISESESTAFAERVPGPKSPSTTLDLSWFSSVRPTVSSSSSHDSPSFEKWRNGLGPRIVITVLMALNVWILSWFVYHTLQDKSAFATATAVFTSPALKWGLPALALVLLHSFQFVSPGYVMENHSETFDFDDTWCIATATTIETVPKGFRLETSYRWSTAGIDRLQAMGASAEYGLPAVGDLVNTEQPPWDDRDQLDGAVEDGLLITPVEDGDKVPEREGAVYKKRKWCRSCKAYRPLRASHCDACQRCVLLKDHHCEILGNCTGKQNYRYWLCTVVTLHLVICHAWLTCAWTILACWPGGLWGSLSSNALEYVLCLIIYPFLSLPPFSLLVYHAFIIHQGITTNEHLKGYADFDDKPNPWDKGLLGNVMDVLCRSRGPSHEDLV